MRKKTVILFVATLLVTSLCIGCGASTGSDENSVDSGVSQTASSTADDTPAENEEVAFEYTVRDDLDEKIYGTTGGALLTKYTGNATNVVVPTEIDGYQVVGFDGWVFTDNNDIVSVDLNGTIAVISEYAFQGCKGLKQVTGLENVKIVENSAFNMSNQIEELYFSEGLTELGQLSLTNYGENTQVWIPESCAVLEEGCLDWGSDTIHVVAGSAAEQYLIEAEQTNYVTDYNDYGK